jgi:hypothetical protein
METKENKSKVQVFNLVDRINDGREEKDSDHQFIESCIHRTEEDGNFETDEEMERMNKILHKHLTAEEKSRLRHGDAVQMYDGEYNDGLFLWHQADIGHGVLKPMDIDTCDYGNVPSCFPINKLATDIVSSHYYSHVLARNNEVVWFDTSDCKIEKLKTIHDYSIYRISNQDDDEDDKNKSVEWCLVTNTPLSPSLKEEKEEKENLSTLFCLASNEDEKRTEDKFGSIFSKLGQDFLARDFPEQKEKEKEKENGKKGKIREKHCYKETVKLIEYIIDDLKIPEERILITEE